MLRPCVGRRPRRWRPQVDGIFSNLSPEQARDAAADGLRVQVAIDNRYESSPSILKIIVMVLAALSVLVAVVALGLLEEHMGGCVVDAAKAGDAEAAEKVQEASAAIARLVRS